MFQLINQGEVKNCISDQVTLKLKYAVLKGCSLNLFDEVPPEEDPDQMDKDSDWEDRTPRLPMEEYIVMRKHCILDQD